MNKANDIHKGETPFSWFFSRLCRYGVQIFGGRFERVAILKPPVFIIFYFCVPKTFTVIKLRSGAKPLFRNECHSQYYSFLQREEFTLILILKRGISETVCSVM